MSLSLTNFIALLRGLGLLQVKISVGLAIPGSRPTMYLSREESAIQGALLEPVQVGLPLGVHEQSIGCTPPS